MDAQIADPEELQVLDIFLGIKSVVRSSVPMLPRHTEGNWQNAPSPFLGHAQQYSIYSHISVIESQSKAGRTTHV